ncbi:MAG TPA: hypothetical protein VK756_09610 [Solirubrobacteraceae bacterium]|jgi:hypothetical protein|nr:hypothetical protein [Solirubrobacteraceae bacterium]
MRFPSAGIGPRRGLISLARTMLLAALLAGSWLTLVAPGARAALSVEKWEAGTCKVSSCGITSEDPSEFYTQAAGHPNFGITNFAFKTREVAVDAREPEGKVKDVRVDLPPGLAVNPEAVEACPETVIEKFECPAASQVGEEEAIGTAELGFGGLRALSIKTTVTEHFGVYNVQRKPGEAARFGVEVTSSTLALAEGLTGHKLQSVIYLEGGISWHSEAADSENNGVQSGDYHEFFRIQNIPQEPEIVQSKLIFWGVPHEHEAAAKDDAFLTMPSSKDACERPQTTWLHVDSYESPGSFIADPVETVLQNKAHTVLTATGCGDLAFEPTLSLTPETSQFDQPDGASVDLHVPQTTTEPSKPNSPDVQTAAVSLPEGMTLNPSAANGLQACSNAQVGLGTDNPLGCPVASKIGTVTVDAPGIPNGSLTGSIYVGAQESQLPESGEEYRVFLVAEAPSYGVGVRLEGRVAANEKTGRLTATFAANPQVTFEDIVLKFNGGARAPLANPLSCGAATPTAAIAPYSGPSPNAKTTVAGFTVGSGSSPPCPAPLPFTLSQSTQDHPSTAGALSTFTFNLARADGQQYLSQVRTVLAPGLLGAIPSVTLCQEAQASAGACPVASEIGTATVTAGAGPEPYPFSGHVYLTASYDGAPYGLSIVVPAVAGPFNLGTVRTRARIGVETYTGQVVVTAAVPTIQGGVPVRLKTLSVAVNRPNFLFNPTDCGVLATNSGLASIFGASQSLATPFQVGECAKLPFKPSLSAYSGAKTTRANGASLEVKIAQGPHEANIREVQLQLPKQLPARQSTLKKACLAASFEAGSPPGACTSASKVGSATVNTPVLPNALTGDAYLVSHGGEAFPDLDLVLSGDGVKVVLVGHTHISSTGITTSTFETLPDVPISSVVVNLPVGPQSVLSANANLCKSPLTAPTTIVAQSGAKLTQQTPIAVRNCPFAIVGHRTARRRAILRVRVPGAGSVTLSGHDLRIVRRRVGDAGTFKLSIRLTRAGRRALRIHRRLRVKLHAKFAPRSGHRAKASVTLVFRA